MSREELAYRSGGMKKDTIDKKINGTSPTRALTRKRIISDGLGVDSLDFRRIENAFENDRDVSEILATTNQPEAKISLENLERRVDQIANSLEGITGPVARTLLASFGARLSSWSPGQIEEKFVQLAKEYNELKEQIRLLSSSDPEVRLHRNRALEHTERGEFDEAIRCLNAARKIDQLSKEKVQKVLAARSTSEAQTVLANAKILGLKLKYISAVDASMEAHTLACNYSEQVAKMAIMASLDHLKNHANDIGAEGAIEEAIRKLDTEILPRISDGSPIFFEAEYCLADLFFLKGYRHQENKWLLLAARKFRRSSRRLQNDLGSEQFLQNVLRLGDAHGEMGLNRNSEKQLRLGADLMSETISKLEQSGFKQAALNGKIRYGTVRANLALLTNDAEDYRQAQSAYNEAKAVALASELQVAAARADWGIAITYVGEAERTGNLHLFDLAIEACDAASRVINKESYPIDWSTIISNRANAKLERGRKENGTASLFEALTDFDTALSVRTKKRHLLGHAKSLGNKAIALRIIGERERDKSIIERSIRLFEDVSGILPNISSYWQSYYASELKLARASLDEI